MYRKARKTVQSSLRDTDHQEESLRVPVESSFSCITNAGMDSKKINIPAKTVPFSSNINTSASNKRKNPFDDIDLSDIKIDTTLPSFANVSTSFTTESNIENLRKPFGRNAEDRFDLDDEDMDDDILGLTGDDASKKKTKKVDEKHLLDDIFEDGDLDELLDDDFELDDSDIDILTTHHNKSKSSNQQCNDFNSGFKTASGNAISINRSNLFKIRKIFEPIEILFLKEIACFVWNRRNKTPF